VDRPCAAAMGRSTNRLGASWIDFILHNVFRAAQPGKLEQEIGCQRLRSLSSSSRLFGQSDLSSLDSARSASSFPSVWQAAQ
jgi:hypothetical protein